VARLIPVLLIISIYSAYYNVNHRVDLHRQPTCPVAKDAYRSLSVQRRPSNPPCTVMQLFCQRPVFQCYLYNLHVDAV